MTLPDLTTSSTQPIHHENAFVDADGQRRYFVGELCLCRVDQHGSSRGLPFAGRGRWLSLHALEFTTDRPIEDGSRVVVELSLPGRKPPEMAVLVETTGCKRLAHDWVVRASIHEPYCEWKPAIVDALSRGE